MKKRQVLTCAMMALLLGGANAQSKISTATHLLMGEQKASGTSTLRKAREQKADQRVLTVIRLEKGAVVTDEQLAALDIQVEKRRGVLIFAHVPVSKLAELAKIEGISKVDTGNMLRPLNDKAREASFVPMVHSMNVVGSSADMPEQYRGKGVLVAIIDKEIDLGHPAFRDANGKYRIKQVVESFPVLSEEGEITGLEAKKYGEDQIDQAIEDTKDREIEVGHGTHVAGIVAGSTDVLPDGNPMKAYYGMAPEAEYLMYDIVGAESEILNSLSDAFDIADQLQRPLVVNISMGNNDARLDGTDEFNVNLRELVASYDMTGKLICGSAGNEGSDPMSVQMDCNRPIENGDWTAQHTLSLFPLGEHDQVEYDEGKTGYEGRAIFSFYASDDREFGVKYVFTDTLGNELAHTPLFISAECVEEIQEFETDGFTDMADLYYVNVKTASECSTTGRTYVSTLVEYGGTAPIRVQATIGTRSEGMQIDGAVTHGMFDPEACTSPVNSRGSLNVLLCNDIAIGVGAYNTNLKMQTLIGNFQFPEPWELGDISLFSSCGDPHYGDYGPSVIAPGTALISAMHHSIDSTQILARGTTPYEGKDYLWAYDQGTSMSSPAAAGVVALWLQANPELTREDVLDILANTCEYDQFCEALPNYSGYGKINAKRGMDYILGQTVGLTSVGEEAGCKAAKYIDANGRILIRKGNRCYDVVGELVK